MTNDVGGNMQAGGYHQVGAVDERGADNAERKVEDATVCHEREPERKIVGLLAQEVRQVLPDAVVETVRSCPQSQY